MLPLVKHGEVNIVVVDGKMLMNAVVVVTRG